MDKIRIQVMDNFAIYINEELTSPMLQKSRKGLALVQYLIVNHDQPVANSRLLTTFWSEEKSTNPENALKTLVSRTRVILNEVAPGLGSCVVATRGSYQWQSGENVSVDFIEVEELLKKLDNEKLSNAQRTKLMEELIKVYTGDLLQNAELNEWVLGYATTLHNRYMQAIFRYIEMLKTEEHYTDIIATCRAALQIDNFDDHLNMELMSALIKTNRANEALVQYKHVVHMHYRFLGIQPSEDMRDFYKQIVHAGKTLDFNLESIRNELRESGVTRGAFVCEYAVFKEIFNLQMRNLERLGSTMFLAVLMVSDISGEEIDNIRLDNIMQGLLDILCESLRKGDTITHFAPNMYALLLPTVNYSTGNMVIERVKRSFYSRFANSNVVLNYRIGPLTSEKPRSENK